MSFYLDLLKPACGFVFPNWNSKKILNIISSMYGISTYIWDIYGVNVGKYTIHGGYGKHNLHISMAIQEPTLEVPTIYIHIYIRPIFDAEISGNITKYG